jgi:hypothetical protein
MWVGAVCYCLGIYTLGYRGDMEGSKGGRGVLDVR